MTVPPNPPVDPPWDELKAWIGRTETAHDTIVAAPLQGLAATLDRAEAVPELGKPVAPLGHWLFFLPRHRQSELGPDGHARLGGFLPPVPLPRRMWAGSQLQWQPGNPLRVGDAVQRQSRIDDVTHKRGRRGDLVFVRVQHQLSNARGPVLSELHDIVYRAAAAPGEPEATPQAAPTGAAWQRTCVPDDVLLFRYSALTFNGHRIHYDRAYTTGQEGYPGLVVHGPLIATLLLDLLHRHWPNVQLSSFRFKGHRPCFDGRSLQLNGQPDSDGKTVRLWAQDDAGWLCMDAQAQTL